MTPTAEALADRRKELDDARWSMERSTRGLGRRRRPTLSRYDRERILTKSGRRCHICGGEIEGNDWQADHVLALTVTTTAGRDIENYLPAHRSCNPIGSKLTSSVRRMP